MAAPTWNLYDSAVIFAAPNVSELGFKLALLDSSYAPDPAHTVWADVSAHEITPANGYPAGGLAVLHPHAVTGQPGGSTQIHFDNVTFQPAPDDLTAHFVVLRCTDTIDGQVEPLVGYGLLDGADVDVEILSTGEPFIWYWSVLGAASFATGAVPGPPGPSAYEVAVANGFIGTEAEWLLTLVGPSSTLSDDAPLPPGAPDAGISPDGSRSDHAHAPPRYAGNTPSGIPGYPFFSSGTADIEVPAGLAYQGGEHVRFYRKNPPYGFLGNIEVVLWATVSGYVGTTLSVEDIVGAADLASANFFTFDLATEWSHIQNVPEFGTVAFSNDYSDLDNRPTLGTAAAEDATAFDPAGTGQGAADALAATLGTASLHDAGDFEPAGTADAAIAALGLGSAATHSVEEFDANGAAAAAQSAAISAAASDATTKANAAQSNAETYADALAAPHFTDGVSSSTPTPAIGADGIARIYELSALAVAAAFQTPTGTPQQGQKLLVRIYSAGAYALTWPGAYRAHGVALPTMTVPGKWLRVGLEYMTSASLNMWCCIASAQEA